MKKTKRRILALLCMICMLAGNVLPVNAASMIRATSKVPVLNSVSVSTESKSDRTAMVVPDSFDVKLNISAPEGTEIHEIVLNYAHYVDDDFVSHKSATEEYDDVVPGTDGADFEITVNVPEYAGKGEYILDYVFIFYDDTNITYFNNYEGQLEAGDDDDEILDSVDYDGEADYVVVPHDKEDSTAPVIKDLRFKTDSSDGKIYPNTEIIIEMDYLEAGNSGISYASVDYYSEEADEVFSVEFSADEEGEVTGEGTIKLTSDQRVSGDYQLYCIAICDYADNYQFYDVEYVDGKPVLCDEEDMPCVNDIFKNLTTEFTVSPIAYNNLKIVGVKASENAQSLTAGDEFTVTVTLENPTDKAITFYPEDLMIDWLMLDEDEYYYYEAWGEEDEISIAAKATYEYKMEVATSAFDSVGERVLCSVQYYTHEDGDLIISCDHDGEGLICATDSYHDSLYSFKYNGEADYNIIKADKVDESAPLIESISVKSTENKVSGEVTFVLKLAEEEGDAKIENVYLEFYDPENEDNWLYLDTYTELDEIVKIDDLTYEITTEIPDYAEAATFVLSTIVLFDEAGNESYYCESDEDAAILYNEDANDSIKKISMVVNEADEDNKDDDNDIWGFGPEAVYRIFGKTRYETSYYIADALKAQQGVDKFDTVILANGNNFPDALAGSYLAGVTDAPILMASKKNADTLKEYIKANVEESGTIYVLGGTSAIPDTILSGLDGYTIERIAGANRYETNLEILEEAGVTDQPLLICTGEGFADSLSASATGAPILLVKKSLTAAQKEFLEEYTGSDLYIIGGESAVNATLEKQLKAYGDVTRIAGDNRYLTSTAVAEAFFPDAEVAVLAYAKNYPDGLCGGPLAMYRYAPLILTDTKKCAAATEYLHEKGIEVGAVLGGVGLISDDVVKTIFNVDKITVW